VNYVLAATIQIEGVENTFPIPIALLMALASYDVISIIMNEFDKFYKLISKTYIDIIQIRFYTLIF